MVTASVIANSRNSRPTMSPMNSSGISTAISETVSDTMVNPICSAPFNAACSGRSPGLDVAGDVLDHHDGVIHHKAGRNRQRHQREVVQAVAEQVHHAEGADQGERHRHARDDGRGQRPQEQEDHQHDQGHGQHQLELDILDRSPDRRGAVGQHGDLDGRGQSGLELRQARFDAVHDLDDIGAGLALDVDDDRRRVVHPGGLLDVLRVVNHVRHVGEHHGRPVAIGHDDRRR